MLNLFSRCIRDEQGTEVLEYALILGLLVIISMAAIGALGVKIIGRWTSIGNVL